jgi:hypothetical protein
MRSRRLDQDYKTNSGGQSLAQVTETELLRVAFCVQLSGAMSDGRMFPLHQLLWFRW